MKHTFIYGTTRNPGRETVVVADRMATGKDLLYFTSDDELVAAIPITNLAEVRRLPQVAVNFG